MDFISLATAAHETSRHVFRLLIEDTTSTPNEYTSSAAANTAAQQQQYTTGTTSMPQLENRPLLSPTAESALLELSTNFLLYVAMVMITTMVAKIYFPSWLEPREEPQTRMSNHAYMNVMQDAYKDDLSDEEEDEDEDFEGGRYSNGGESNKSTSNEKEEGGSIFLDAGNADDTDDLTPNNGGGRMSRTASSSFLFDYDQETQSKNSVYRNLALCAIMLNVTFVSWGLLQVRFVVSILNDISIRTSYVHFSPFPPIPPGTNAHSSLSSYYWRILHIFICIGIYKSFLDTHHVGHAIVILQAANFS